MSFKEDVEHTPGLREAYREGLRALRGVDRARLTVSSPRRLNGSADIDSALASVQPNAARWDYVVAWALDRHREELQWIEVHPADNRGTVAEIERKLSWLHDWLESDGELLDRVSRRFVWVASGTCAFKPDVPWLKILASKGLQFAGRRHTIS